MTDNKTSRPAGPSHARQLSIAAIILAIGTGGALAIRFSGEKAPTTLDNVERGGPPVVVAEARDAPLRSTATFAGRLEARRSVDLAAEIAGRLSEVRADVGDALRQGETAFRLDDRDARLRVDDLAARLEAAEARQRQSARQAERRKRLGEEGISAPEDVEQAELDDEVARADLVVTRQELKLAERELEKTTVTAPWTGIVVARHAHPGAWVVPGQAVLRLVDLSVVDVRLDLPAADAVHLRPGDDAGVRFPALPGESFSGRVRYVASEASDADLQFATTVELAGDERLGAGMIAEVELRLDRAGRGVAVPLDALHRDQDDAFVWLLEEGHVRRRQVVVAGARAGEAILSSGLAPGESVVVAVSSRLEDGLAVGEVSRSDTGRSMAP